VAELPHGPLPAHPKRAPGSQQPVNSNAMTAESAVIRIISIAKTELSSVDRRMQAIIGSNRGSPVPDEASGVA
jgi:hypothetical protein